MANQWLIRFAQTGSAFLFALTSVWLFFFNRLLLFNYEFPGPSVVILLQSLIIFVLIELLRILRVIKIKGLSLQRLKGICIPSALYAFNAYLTIIHWEGVHNRMLGGVRRSLPFLILALGQLVKPRDKWPSNDMLISICTCTIGSMMAGSYGFWWNEYWGLVQGFFSTSSLALALFQFQRLSRSRCSTEDNDGLQHYSIIELLHGTAFSSIILFCPYSLLTRELMPSVTFMETADLWTTQCFLASLAIGVVNHFAIISCTVLNSAMSTAMVSAIKTLLLILYSWCGIDNFILFVFRDKDATYHVWVGVVITILGYHWYTSTKRTEENQSE